MEKYETIKKEIQRVIKKSPLKFDPGHSNKTLEWVLKLKPDADEALKIAALAHDIERAETGITEGTHLTDYSKLSEFKKEHALRSAQIITELLRKNAYSQEFIKKVENLVKKHEEGGDEETNVLMDADSIAYFDYHIDKYYAKNGRDKTASKISFMFQRISDRAKGIIKNLEFNNPEVKKLVDEVLNK